MTQSPETAHYCHPAQSPNERRWVLLLLLLALSLRCAAAVIIDRHVHHSGRTFLVEGDANGYWELGRKIATGQDYSLHSPPRKVLRTPGFPLLLAASIRLFGDNILHATLVLAATGTLACWLTWKIARRCTGPRSAIATLVLTAIAPLHVGSCVQVLSEGWFTVWLLLSLLTLQPLLKTTANQYPHDQYQKHAHAWQALLAGLTTGCGVLVRPGWILWPPIAVIILLAFGHGSRSQKFAAALMLAIGCWLALLPWAWRNHEVCGHWIHTSLWSGPSLYDGLNPSATGASNMEFFDREQLPLIMDEYEVNEEYKRRAWEFVRQQPIRTLQLAFLKAARFLSPIPQAEGVASPAVSLVSLTWYIASVLLVARGCQLLRQTHAWAPLLLLWAPFLQFLLIHLVFVGSLRYRLPVEFPLLVLAGHALSAMLPLGKNLVADGIAGRDA